MELPRILYFLYLIFHIRLWLAFSFNKMTGWLTKEQKLGSFDKWVRIFFFHINFWVLYFTCYIFTYLFDSFGRNLEFEWSFNILGSTMSEVFNNQILVEKLTKLNNSQQSIESILNFKVGLFFHLVFSSSLHPDINWSIN